MTNFLLGMLAMWCVVAVFSVFYERWGEGFPNGRIFAIYILPLWIVFTPVVAIGIIMWGFFHHLVKGVTQKTFDRIMAKHPTMKTTRLKKNIYFMYDPMARQYYNKIFLLRLKKSLDE